VTPDPDEEAVRRAVAAAHRREWAAVLAATVRVAADVGLAEECVQDAYLQALNTWTRDGIPRNPAAWLTTAARRRVIDEHRRRQTLRQKLPLLAIEEAPPADTSVADDRLRLIFTCCHPALAREAQLALTLRLLCGLTTDEIAAAFLVSTTTMAARLTRAKKKITAAGIPYRVPAPEELPDRLDAVLTVVHLLYTTGHTAPRGPDLRKPELVERALELSALLRDLMPDEAEVSGLHALLLLTEARAGSRFDGDRLIALEDQDRSGWDGAQIALAGRLVERALRSPAPGRFAIQAAISALHAEAPSWSDTDWPQIVGLYDALLQLWPSPVVALNRAVALGLSGRPADELAALSALEGLAVDERLVDYRYLPLARADLLRRMGRPAEAAAAYRAALRLSESEAERGFVQSRLVELDSATAG
jgi:RNA polymerase sigma-70 factor (ECF subfamily)